MKFLKNNKTKEVSWKLLIPRAEDMLLSAVLAVAGLVAPGPHAWPRTRYACPRTNCLLMSLDVNDWKLLRSREDASQLTLAAADPGCMAEEVKVTIPRTESAPSLGLVLEEIASTGDAGIVVVEDLVEGGNGAQASSPIQPGDALIAAAEAGRPSSEVNLEGLSYDEAVGRLGELDAAVGVVVTLKRITRMPRATVRISFPETEDRPDETVTLYEGANLRRAMLSQGVVLNDPLARRFDAGIGTGDCGGEGTCCTCVVEVTEGMSTFTDADSQEKQMVQRKFPRWRLACKARVGELTEDVDIALKVQPRNFKGFYSEDDVDVDGAPLSREGLQ